MAKKLKSTIWMPLYINDYLGDTTHLTTEQHGAYLLLLMHAWKSGGRIPNDPGELQDLTKTTEEGWQSMERRILKFFRAEGAWLVHDRVVDEFQRAATLTERKATGGAIGAKKRWENHRKKLAIVK